MNNIRCGNCGFLNFASAPSCKRCKAEFETAPAAAGSPTFGDYATVPQANYQPAPQWPQPAYQPAYMSPPPIYFPTPLAPLPRASKNGATNAVLWVLLGLTVAIAVGIGILWKFGKSSTPINFAWQEYNAPDDSCSILMPAKPLETAESLPTPTGTQLQLHMSIADVGRQGAYMLGYIDYPDNFKSISSDTLLDAAANGAITRSGATLVNKKKITFDGYPGVEIEMLPPAGAPPGMGHAFCRIYWVAPRIYMTFAGGPDSREGNQAILKFLDSFKLRRKPL